MPLLPIGTVVQKGGKQVTAFAARLAFDPADLRSNSFEMEWPRGSGWRATFPEVDAARWMTLDEAATTMLESQRPLLERIVSIAMHIEQGVPKYPVKGQRDDRSDLG